MGEGRDDRIVPAQETLSNGLSSFCAPRRGTFYHPPSPPSDVERSNAHSCADVFPSSAVHCERDWTRYSGSSCSNWQRRSPRLALQWGLLHKC
jgi:hypothetical protein